jgi:hypothetical protein
MRQILNLAKRDKNKRKKIMAEESKKIMAEAEAKEKAKEIFTFGIENESSPNDPLKQIQMVKRLSALPVNNDYDNDNDNDNNKDNDNDNDNDDDNDNDNDNDNNNENDNNNPKVPPNKKKKRTYEEYLLSLPMEVRLLEIGRHHRGFQPICTKKTFNRGGVVTIVDL